MSGRPATPSGPPPLRLEILKELQQLIDSREVRERLDRGPLAEIRGKEHWVLHLLLRAEESNRSHLDQLVGAAFSNLTARMQALDDRVSSLSESEGNTRAELSTRIDTLNDSVSKTINSGFESGTARASDQISERLEKQLDAKWGPIGESAERFAEGSKQMLKDVSDTYKVATQTRLLLNENARRISDLGKDIVALEDSLKLVLEKTVEELLAPLEARVAQLESAAGVGPAAPAGNGNPAAVSDDPPKASRPDSES